MFCEARVNMKCVSKLYRSPAQARQAIDRLLAAGFPVEDTGLLCFEGGKPHATGGLDKVLGQRPFGSATLADTLHLSAEIADYYEFGIRSGGMLVNVCVAECDLDRARSVLRLSVGRPEKPGMQSPGFHQAGRMSATNPVDATMTGDFRKY